MIHKLALIGDPPEHRDFEGHCLPPNISESAQINAFATVDAGMERPTTVGDRTLLMKHVHLGHDVVVGPDCELAPGVVVGGHCDIGPRVRIGVNACIRPYVRVGTGARIGAGAVVVGDVPPGVIWAGNPAKSLDADRLPIGPSRVAFCPTCGHPMAEPGEWLKNFACPNGHSWERTK